MVSPSYLVSSIGTVFSPISNHAPILCLQLSPTPHFFTVRDQAPRQYLSLEFYLRCSCFPGPLLLTGCGFDPFCPFMGVSH